MYQIWNLVLWTSLMTTLGPMVEGRRIPKFDVEFFRPSALNVEKMRILESNAKELPEEECRKFFDLHNETLFEEIMECHEIMVNSCFHELNTVYRPHKIKECKDHFKKDCYIGYEPTKIVQPIQTCRRLPEKDCSQKGPLKCVDVYETVCNSYLPQEKVNPVALKPKCKTIPSKRCNKRSKSCKEYPVQTCKTPRFSSSNLVSREAPKCTHKPKRICGPKPCSVKYIKSCIPGNKTLIQDLPHESCDITPQKHCVNNTKLIPSLETQLLCMDVPQEVCSIVSVPKSITNTRIRKICKTTSGPWSPYDSWSPCSVSCGNGTQERRRRCKKEGICQGFHSETRMCSMPPCNKNKSKSNSTNNI